MTHIRNHRWLALLACVAMLSLVFGCHGGDILAFLFGSWNGNVVELFTSAMVLMFVLMDVTLSLGDETDSSAVGTASRGDSAHLWANVEGEGAIEYVGTFVQDGNNMTATLVPADGEGVNGLQVGVPSMVLALKAESDTKMVGTLTWYRGAEEFSGPATFDKYPD